MIGNIKAKGKGKGKKINLKDRSVRAVSNPFNFGSTKNPKF